MPLLYFLEKARSVDADKVAELGLSGSIERPVSRECFKGPGGPGGAVFADRSVDAGLRMDLDNQIWHERYGGLWVGFEAERRPKPADLQRPRMIDGEMLELWDGNRWQIPVIREWRISDGDGPPIACRANVPQSLSRDESGDWILGDVVPPYRRIWDRTADAFEYIFGSLSDDGIAAMSDLDAMDFAIEILAVNYRLDYHSVSALALVDFGRAAEVVRIAIGAASFEAAVKNVAGRKATETSNSDSGAERPTQGDQISTPIAQPAAN